MKKHASLNEAVVQKRDSYDDSMIAGENSAIYNFGVGVIEGEELTISSSCISVPGLENDISLEVENPYSDFT